jgi:hypothetical protein
MLIPAEVAKGLREFKSGRIEIWWSAFAAFLDQGLNQLNLFNY